MMGCGCHMRLQLSHNLSGNNAHLLRGIEYNWLAAGYVQPPKADSPQKESEAPSKERAKLHLRFAPTAKLAEKGILLWDAVVGDRHRQDRAYRPSRPQAPQQTSVGSEELP